MERGFWDLRDESDTAWLVARVRESLDRSSALLAVLVLVLMFIAGGIGQFVGAVSAHALLASVEALHYVGTAAGALGFAFRVAPYALVLAGALLLGRRPLSSVSSFAIIVPLVAFASQAGDAERLRAVLPASGMTPFGWMDACLAALGIGCIVILVARRLLESRSRRVHDSV